MTDLANNRPTRLVSGPSKRAVWAINLRFLQCALGAFIAWICWPISKEWWAFGLISILMGIGAFGHFIGTLRIISDHPKRDRDLERFASQGEAKRGDATASPSRQRGAGMLD